MKNFKEKVIIALDYSDMYPVKRLLEKLKGESYFYKIGFELFTSCGAESVKAVKDYGCKVFLDLKYHDIPNTVYKAVKSAGKLGADIINVHASGGVDMMKAAKTGGEEAADITGGHIDIVAVTVLTALSGEDVKRIFYDLIEYKNCGGIVPALALHLAKLAKISGLDGVVCSGRESLEIKNALGEGFKTITPGIRLKKTGRTDDQKRTATPSEAFNSGADYIVVGREVTGADSPADALQNIYRDIEENALK
jgi:orotidine-5'-phosphate decarboxylase